MKKYIAWPTGQQDIVRARIEAHRLADEIAQGVGYSRENDKVRACAVGCSLDRYDHSKYSAVLGIDLRIAKLVDRIHESLPFTDAVHWPGRVAAALKPGADTTTTADRFMVWVLRQGACGRNEHCARVAALYGLRLTGYEPLVREWKTARETAASASASASAAAAAAAYAAADYADYAYADYAAASAAAAAAAAASASASAYASAYAADYARTQYWRDAATALEEILSRCV